MNIGCYTKNHGEWATSRILYLWQHRKLCDVVVIAGTKRIPAHRLILSIGCKYFHDMFTLNVREANQREITIEGVDGQAMEDLISGMYTGKLSVTKNNVENLISAADMMAMDDILSVVIPFLVEQLHPSNCLGIRDFAMARSFRMLIDEAHRYTMNHFEEVVTHEEFLRLPLKQVCQLFDDNRNFYVSNIEVTLLKAALNWLTNNDEDRKQHAPELLSCINFNAIQQEMLSEVVQANPFLRDNEKCRQVLEVTSQGPVRTILRRRPPPMPKNNIKVLQAARLWWSFYCLHPNRAIAELSKKLCAGSRDRKHRERCYLKLFFLIDALATETKLVVKSFRDCRFYQVSRIVNLLNRNFVRVSDESQQLAIKCFAKWMERGLPLDDCKNFMSNILKCASKPGFFEIVAACMVNVCRRKCGPSPTARDSFARDVLSFKPMLLEWIAESNIGSITGLTHWTCECVRATDNSFKLWFTATIFDLFDFVADLTALPLQYPVEERSTDICFELWWELFPRLPTLTDVDEWHSRYKRLYRKLFCTVLVKCRYPINGSYANWSEASRKLHRTYRSQSFKLASIISKKIGPDETFQNLLYQFKCTAEDRPYSVDFAEPWLFGICAVCYSHIPQKFSQLPHLVDALIAVPTVSNRIGDTIFILVSILASYSWLEEHPDLAERLFSKILEHIRDSKSGRRRTAVNVLVHMANECFSVTGLGPSEYFNKVMDDMLQQTVESSCESDFRLLNSAILKLASLPRADFFELREKFLESVHRKVLELSRAEPSLSNNGKMLLLSNALGSFQALYLEDQRITRRRRVTIAEVLPIPAHLEEIVAKVSNHWIDCLNLCNHSCCCGAVEHPRSNAVCLLEDLTENGKWPRGFDPRIKIMIQKQIGTAS